MNLLFVHQNFPGQFVHLARAGIAQGWQVAAICSHSAQGVPGARLVRYPRLTNPGRGLHPWARDLQVKAIRAEAAARAALHLRQSGFVPDLIYGHPGWGECLLLKEIFPDVPQINFLEFFYNAKGADVGFDPEFPIQSPWAEARIRFKNMVLREALEDMTLGVVPTRWQAAQIPERWQNRLEVVFDGIDTDIVRPDAEASLQVGSGPTLSRQDELITFVSRNLEPYRGFHVFMRALPELLRRRPRAQVLIVGGDKVSYGRPPHDAATWREAMMREVGDRLDLGRVRFLGNIPYPEFLKLLQVSRVHVYLTYPFVLSWSLVEAMSAGCALVASDTPPVAEFLRHRETARLFPFFDGAQLTDQVCGLLDDPREAAALGRAARELVLANYDLNRTSLPRLVRLMEDTARRRPA